MKKIFILCIVSVLLTGCNKGDSTKEFIWDEADFSFYNDKGQETKYPTTDDYWIDLSDANEETGENLVTYRGVAIGEKAANLPMYYDLTDFEYSVVDYSLIRWDSEEANELDIEMHETHSEFADILDSLYKTEARELGVYAWCDIYKVDGKLMTVSFLNEDESDDSSFLLQHLKYTLSFEISNQRITDVNIRSEYHNFLNGVGRMIDLPGWEWLIEMGK